MAFLNILQAPTCEGSIKLTTGAKIKCSHRILEREFSAFPPSLPCPPSDRQPSLTPPERDI